jgi:hypothetical protein
MRRGLVGVALVLAGCFSPGYGNGDLSCQAGAHPCPDGFHCAPLTGTCWRDGSDPPKPAPRFWTSCGGGAMVATGGSGATLSLSLCELPVGGAVQSRSGATLELGLFPDTSH